MSPLLGNVNAIPYTRFIDAIAPLLVSVEVGAVADDEIVLTYDEELDDKTPATGDYSVSGTAETISSVTVDGLTVTLAMSSDLLFGVTYTVSYTAGTNKIRDKAKNNVADLVNEAITNTIIDVAAPTVTSIEVGAVANDVIQIHVSESLDTSDDPATGDFSVSGTTGSISHVSVGLGTSILVTLDADIYIGETVTISYTAGSNPVQDVAGNALADFTNSAVTNNSSADIFEDLTSYTEVDPEGNFTVTEDEIDVVDIHPEHTTSYVYYDFGVGNLKQNFEIRFALNVSDIWTDHALQGVIGVANTLGLDVEGPNVEINYDYTDAGSGDNYLIGVGGGDHVAHSNTNHFLQGVTYYCKLERIFVGGVEDNIVQITIYTDPEYTIRAKRLYGGGIGNDLPTWGELDFSFAHAYETFRYLMLATSGRADYDDTEVGSFSISNVKIVSNSGDDPFAAYPGLDGEVIDESDNEYSELEVDYAISVFATCTNCTFDISGTNAHRTAASNDDLNTLYENGNTITLNDSLGAEKITGGDFTIVGVGSDLNTSNCVNGNYTGFANGTPTGFDATSNGASAHFAGTADEIPIVNNKKFVVLFDCVLNGGLTAPVFDLKNILNGTTRTAEGAQTAVNGANVFEFTATGTTTGVLEFRNDTTTADYEITNLHIKNADTLWDDSDASWDRTGGVGTYDDANNDAGILQTDGDMASSIGTEKVYRAVFKTDATPTTAAMAIMNAAEDVVYLAQDDYTDDTHTRYFTTPADVSGAGIAFVAYQSGDAFDLDDVSLKEVTFP